MTWLQVAAQTMDIAMALGGNMGGRHQHGTQLDPDIALSGSTDHKLQHRLRWLHRSLTSTWLLAAAWPTDVNMAPGSGTDHGQLYVPRWQYGPLNIHMLLRLHHGLGQQYRPLRTARCPGEAWATEAGVSQ